MRPFCQSNEKDKQYHFDLISNPFHSAVYLKINSSYSEDSIVTLNTISFNSDITFTQILGCIPRNFAILAELARQTPLDTELRFALTST